VKIHESSSFLNQSKLPRRILKTANRSAPSRIDASANKCTVAPVSARDQLSQRIRDMNISTSYISDCHTDSPPAPPSRRHGNVCKDVNSRSVAQRQMSSLSVKHSDDPESQRKYVLECIGRMFDEGLISEAEASQSIALAMDDASTYRRMAILFESRDTLAARSFFLRLWLRELKTKQPFAEQHGVTETTKVVVPSQEFSGTGQERPLSRADSHLNLERLPIPSPPLVPISLNFTDSSPRDDGISMLPVSSRIRDPVRLMKYSNPPLSTPSTSMSPSPELFMGRLGSQTSDDFQAYNN
jgi:hypothetical protein